MKNPRALRSIESLAEEIIDTVDREHLSKTAGSAYINGEPQTELGQNLKKLADAVRNEAAAPVTYSDLERFRKTHGI